MALVVTGAKQSAPARIFELGSLPSHWGNAFVERFGFGSKATDLGLEFVDRFQDKLMFGTDACQRMTERPDSPNVEFLNKLRDEKLISAEAWTKIASGNATRLMGL